MRVCEHVRERGVEERRGPEMMDDVCARIRRRYVI